MLEINGLQVRYGDFIAVAQASLRVDDGQVIALIGANGAGKSSLLCAVSGLLKPAGGTVFFSGEDITGMLPDQVAARGLSLVPQGGRCFHRMTVEENLLVGSYPSRARASRRDTLAQVYDLFPALKEKRKDITGILSGGQRQMVAIGRALMAEPSCVLFDEISMGLAPVVVQEIYAAIRGIIRERKLSVLLVEQDTERALRMSDRTYVMLEGRISLSGASRDLSAEAIREAYFGWTAASAADSCREDEI